MSLSFIFKRALGIGTYNLANIKNHVPQSALNRHFSIAQRLRNEAQEESAENSEEVNDAKKKDRIPIIPVETSIKYLKSKAYQTTYGTDPVWVNYRRNHKGRIPPHKTRKTCIRGGQLTTGNACPICRDEYLVLHPDNIELLKQFISTYTGETLSFTKTGLCQRRFKELKIAIGIAKDRGLITYDVPFREYDYSEYNK